MITQQLRTYVFATLFTMGMCATQAIAKEDDFAKKGYYVGTFDSATFDPAFHGPQGIGPVNRFVSVDTNDKNNSQLTFTVLGTIVK